MRYRQGQEVEPLAQHASDGMLWGTTIYGFLLGLVFAYVGFRFRQRWLAIWGLGLSIASLATMIWMP